MIEAKILNHEELPIYLRIAEKARQLKELGMSDKGIAAALGVSDKTVAKAVDAVGGQLSWSGK